MTSSSSLNTWNMLQANLEMRLAGWRNRQRLAALARQVAANARPSPGQAPIVVVNISSRITGLSLNAAFSLLASWGLRLAGAPVKHFVCDQGLNPCVLGTNREDYTASPPCQACISQSNRLFAGADVYRFRYHADQDLQKALEGLSIEELSVFEHPFIDRRLKSEERGTAPIPLGKLVMPSLRWALRRHNMPEAGSPQYEAVRRLLRQYILSAYNIAQEFAVFLQETSPAAVLIFNGAMYPEAAARWTALQRGVRAVTHEVGFQQFSTFFTEKEATAYPLDIPQDFRLTPEQDKRLDAYLQKRFQGEFTMAGIRFWPEIRRLDPAFLEKAASFRQVVPVFTNVVYDTSQVHANVVFPHMFAWLDEVLKIIRAHPETLFVVRAHPDEMRPGSKKLSNESVEQWAQRNGLYGLPNVVMIGPLEYLSSYELIQLAKFVLVYNSSIGMEAALLGAAVICGGKARYTQLPIVYFPPSAEAFRRQVEEFLDADSPEEQKPGDMAARARQRIPIPPEHQENARRFLYWQLYRASLPMGRYLQVSRRQGFVQLRPFSWRDLLPENSASMRAVIDGMLHGKAFLIDDEDVESHGAA